jgi:hypothetical protein
MWESFSRSRPRRRSGSCVCRRGRSRTSSFETLDAFRSEPEEIIDAGEKVVVAGVKVCLAPLPGKFD